MGELRAAPGHPPMTQDAMLRTAAQTAEANDAHYLRLQASGVMVDLSAFVERRLEALVQLLLPDDHARAELELRYQDLVAAGLDEAERAADAARARATLLAPAGPPNGNRAARRRGPGARL